MNKNLMTRLFLSHASEDKNSLARPLAAALREKFDVWFDETELRAGDSLREKIDHGLRNCDFGIVILSEAFFAKKWTNAELNGLFGLEDLNRKVILPIWHGVDAARVREFSPMLADRVALQASKGIARLVEDICLATEASSRTQHVLSPDKGVRALIQMQGKLAGLKLDEKIFRTEAGVELLLQSIRQLGDRLVEKLRIVDHSISKFSKTDEQDGFVIDGPLRVTLSVMPRNIASNSINGSWLRVAIVVRGSELTGSRNELVKEEAWMFTCLSVDQLGFIHRHQVESVEPDPEILSIEELSTQILSEYCDQISARVAELRSKEI